MPARQSSSAWQDQLSAASRRLQRTDPQLARVIRRVGPCQLKLERNRFRMLARSIISQQISVHAARTIHQRLHERLDGRWTAERCAGLSVTELRQVGLSGQKTSYLQDLCRLIRHREIRLTRIQTLDDEQVIEMLTQVRGIGRWTAEMFLIFSLGRLDVLPVDDLGIRKGIQHLAGHDELPRPAACREYGERWRPYASVASWYCWRIDSSVDFF